MQTHTPLATLLVAALALSVVAPSAHAAPTQKELDAARDAFKAGLEKEKAGDYAGALEQFEIVAKVKLTPQVRFHMALCHDKLGKLKLAASEYELAAKEAEEKKVAEVLKAAPGLAKEARERLAKLTLSYPEEGTPEKLKIDSDEVDPAVAQKDGVLLDPGPHVVLATSAGGKELRLEVVLAEKEQKTLEVDIEPKAAPAPVKPVEAPEAPPPAPPPQKDLPAPSSSLRTIGLVAGGFGLVSLGLAGVFYGVRIGAVHDLEGQCTPDLRCPTAAGDTLDKAKTFTTLSRVALGVGVVSLGVGAVLFLKGGQEEAPRTAHVRLVPYAPSASVGLGLEGGF